MLFQPRRQRRAFIACIALSLLISLPAWAADKTHLHVDDYQISIELTPHAHKISAHAVVKFTALEDLNIATFNLHNDLRITKVTDATGKLLTAERLTQDSSVRVPLAATLPKDSSTTLTFDYEGILDAPDDSPVQGLKLAYVGDDTSYLLYAGDWFPVNNYGINRFTATINVTVPSHMMVIGSGKETIGTPPASKKALPPLQPPPRLTLSSGTNPAFPAPLLPDPFRNLRATTPASICTFSSSPTIRPWPPSMPKPPSKNSLTT